MTKKLVIIDDSSTQLNILKTLFTNEGWDVCGVQSAKIGYEIIFDFAPDLIITDAIMPLMGGFQLVKMIRENPKISRIPVIVYSILNETNAKFYIKEELSEYFLRKENNHQELFELACKITQKFPLEKEYKDEILRTSLENYKQIQKEEVIETPEETEVIEEIKQIDFNQLRKNIKTSCNFSFGDEKVLSFLFSNLYDILDYDLAVIGIHSFEDDERKIYFDIRDIILSPILRNTILAKYDAKISAMYKKYAPNLVTIVNESEFLSKLEFNFEYKDENILDIAFYSREKLKWEDEEKNNSLKEILYDFSRARFIQRSAQNTKKEENLVKYQKQTSTRFDGIKNNPDAYFAIIQISNMMDLMLDLSNEDMDVLNSKISEKIIECLDKDEQVYKNDEEEYDIVIFAKDEKHAYYRLGYILDEIEQIHYNEYKLQGFAYGASCNIEDNFNIVEAQKHARKLFDESLQNEKVVIYNE